jgi:hypothetical protein
MVMHLHAKYHKPTGMWKNKKSLGRTQFGPDARTDARMDRVITIGRPPQSGGALIIGLIFSHRVMTFGMYVHVKETMCCIPILKIVHNYHTSIFPVLQVHKFHLHRTHWWGPHEMAPISMVSSYTSSHDQNFDFNWQHLVFRSMWLFLCCAILWPSRYQCCVSNITVFKWLF